VAAVAAEFKPAFVSVEVRRSSAWHARRIDRNPALNGEVQQQSSGGVLNAGKLGCSNHCWSRCFQQHGNGMDGPIVSIIMRSFNEGWALKDTLPALQNQSYRRWELIVIDSGSRDGSVDLIRAANPAHFIQIESCDYNPSRVMNHGMGLAKSDFGIFLNADATPVDDNWLHPLVSALQPRNTAAVFGRQIPRPNCRAVFAHDYERCFGSCRETGQWEHFFSMVSSGLRKDIWAKRGFSEKLQYSEDDEYTRWCRAQGYQVAYVAESTVIHSHNYTPAQAYKRLYGESKALAAVWMGKPSGVSWPKTFLLGWINDMRRDAAYCFRTNRPGEFPYAALVRFQQRRARVEGFRDGWRHYRSVAGAESSASNAELRHQLKAT
jgi:rhamnosyltransferase